MASVTFSISNGEKAALAACGCTQCGTCCFLDGGGSPPASLNADVSELVCWADVSPVLLTYAPDSYTGTSSCAAFETVGWTLSCNDGTWTLSLLSDITGCIGVGTLVSVTCSPFEAIFTVEQTTPGCGCCAQGSLTTVTITE